MGSFAPNPWGLHEMHGNVNEWVADCWNDSYGGAPEDGSPWGSGYCASSVLRGGSWVNGPWMMRAALRWWAGSSDRYSDLGFRVARTFTP